MMVRTELETGTALEKLQPHQKATFTLILFLWEMMSHFNTT